LHAGYVVGNKWVAACAPALLLGNLPFGQGIGVKSGNLLQMVHSGVFTMLPAMSSVRMRSRVSAFSRVAEDRAKFEPIRDQSAEGLLRFYYGI